MSSKQSLVSIIIPAFNAGFHIRETLASVSAQDYGNWECLLIDDGSSDDTVAIIKEYIALNNRFQYYGRPLTYVKGPSTCRNIGIENAKGNYVLFLDADDLLAPYCLSSRIKFAKENFNADFWIFKMHTFRNLDKTHLFNLLPDVHSTNENEFYISKFINFDIPFPITSPLWQLSTLKYLKGFDSELSALEDPDLVWRAFQNGWNSKTAVALKEDCYYRLRDKSFQNSKLSGVKIKSVLKYYSKHLSTVEGDKRVFFQRLLNLYIFPYKSIQFLFQSLQIATKAKIITFWQAIQILFLWSYRKIGAHKIKGSGYTSLQKSIFRKIS